MAERARCGRRDPPHVRDMPFFGTRMQRRELRLCDLAAVPPAVRQFRRLLGAALHVPLSPSQTCASVEPVRCVHAHSERLIEQRERTEESALQELGPRDNTGPAGARSLIGRLKGDLAAHACHADDQTRTRTPHPAAGRAASRRQGCAEARPPRTWRSIERALPRPASSSTTIAASRSHA
jgi:hypothetical protein